MVYNLVLEIVWLFWKQWFEDSKPESSATETTLNVWSLGISGFNSVKTQIQPAEPETKILNMK